MDASDDLVGQTLGGHFKLTRPLGSGAMGMVYEAEQIGFNRRCAVKLLKRDLHSHSSLLRRFKREAQVVARLNHPNIVSLYDFGVSDSGQHLYRHGVRRGLSPRAAQTL